MRPIISSAAFLAALSSSAAFLAALSSPAHALDVTVIGVFKDKAVVQIDGKAARTLAIGQKTPEGVTVVSVERDGATLDIEGKRRSLKLGQHHASGAASSSAQTVTLAADTRGHFITQGQINGQTVTFIVDTGATSVSISSAEAKRLGINYTAGQAGSVQTANGNLRAWRVVFASVRIGDITIDSVEGTVADNPAMPALLGMSFLNRTNMRREGQLLTLTKRF